MRYYQNQVLPLTTATLPDAPYSKATEITPQPRSAVKAKSSGTFTAMQESTCHKEAAELLRSEAAVNDIPVTISARDYRALKRRLPPEEADFFRKNPGAVVARNLRRFGSTHFHIGAPGLNVLRSKAAQ
ncbi:MAG: hypothetical protein Q8L79_12695 [Methylobacter sp.]|uniref:hypothetical protein n=1 Tax=Methylobacter sp. TaxID=2051955 RepID=UPI00272F900A|nr:hypothetical protein [Methylobacter sp.]MDP1665970.1 hypothetical protein [Methylobacter sp.]